MNKKENVKEEELEQTKVEEQEQAAGEKETEKTAELTPEEQAIANYNEVNEKYLRLYSDFENFRKRTQKEKDN